MTGRALAYSVQVHRKRIDELYSQLLLVLQLGRHARTGDDAADVALAASADLEVSLLQARRRISHVAHMLQSNSSHHQPFTYRYVRLAGRHGGNVTVSSRYRHHNKHMITSRWQAEMVGMQERLRLISEEREKLLLEFKSRPAAAPAAPRGDGGGGGGSGGGGGGSGDGAAGGGDGGGGEDNGGVDGAAAASADGREPLDSEGATGGDSGPGSAGGSTGPSAGPGFASAKEGTGREVGDSKALKRLRKQLADQVRCPLASSCQHARPARSWPPARKGSPTD